MSLIINKGSEIKLKNEESIALSEIFNAIESLNQGKHIQHKDSPLLQNIDIKNIKINPLININTPSKNKYKVKLQNLLLKK